MPAQRIITLEELSQYFHLPEKVVAKKLGVCLTSLKKLCRQHGIHRWPYRKLKSIEKKISKLETSLSNPSEDAQAVQCKLTSLNFEKKRLPFTGVPSSAYGGVRRSNSPSNDSSSLSGHTSPSNASDKSSAATPRSSSPLTLISCGSGNSKLAARLRAVGSVNEHRQRLAATLGVNFDDSSSVGLEASSDATTECEYAGLDDFTEQPEDEPEEGLLSGELANSVVFDTAMEPMFGDGVDLMSFSGSDFVSDSTCGFEGGIGDALDNSAEEFFASLPPETAF